MKTILIADDHEIVRSGIRLIIESFSKNYHCIEASTSKEVMQLLSTREIDTLILDMFLADGSMLSTVEYIIQLYPQTGILVYSTNAENIYGKRLIQKGVRGFVCKQTSLGELEKAIRTVLNGEIYLSQQLKTSLLQPAKLSGAQNPIDMLSDRELEVVEYIVMGMGTKEVAEKMSLDTTTISTYRRRAFEKFGVQDLITFKEKFLLYKM
jgi:two-component system, NarL family, invasion response regulator UvrY